MNKERDTLIKIKSLIDALLDEEKEAHIHQTEQASFRYWFIDDNDVDVIPIGSQVGSVYHDLRCNDGSLDTALIELATGEVFNVYDIDGNEQK